MAPGDRLLLLTDGFYEREAPDGAMLEQAPIAKIAAEHAQAPADELLEALFAAADAFADGRPAADDMTAIVVRRK